jgi:hydroxyacylglutathione hydrolase
MKPFFRYTVYGLMLLFTAITTIQGQTSQMKSDDPQPAAKKESKNESWFRIKTIADNVWCIDDHGGDNIYLVTGKEKALLIDTGTGIADLLGCVNSLTNLPIEVVNTHGHPDHCGGNFQFEEVHVNPQDFELTRRFSSKEYHENAIKQQLASQPNLASYMLQNTKDFKMALLIPVKAGDVFDLGERKLEVVEVPGHTKGSICLLDKENKLMFSGDNNNTLVWLFLDGCLPLESYLETLQHQKARSAEFDTLLPGHGIPIDVAFIDEQIACVQTILDGSCKGEDYQTFVGPAKLCTYQRAKVAFNPDNLYKNH